MGPRRRWLSLPDGQDSGEAAAGGQAGIGGSPNGAAAPHTPPAGQLACVPPMQEVDVAAPQEGYGTNIRYQFLKCHQRTEQDPLKRRRLPNALPREPWGSHHYNS